jgi:membrane associated rhomboid family serine protease
MYDTCFFYILCGIAAVFVQTGFGPDSQIPMVGASGAISGVLGAYFILYPRARIVTFVPVFIFFYLFEVPAFFFLGFWIFLQFIQGSVHWLATKPVDGGGVAWWAHMGGFGAGFLLVPFFRKYDKQGKKRRLFFNK